MQPRNRITDGSTAILPNFARFPFAQYPPPEYAFSQSPLGNQLCLALLGMYDLRLELHGQHALRQVSLNSPERI